MFKYAVVIFAVIACAAGKPHLVSAPLGFSAPAAVVAAPAPVITATSSQVITRNYNGIATAPVVAPVAPVAFSAPVARYASAYSHPLAFSAPLVASYAAAAPLSYSAPLTYAAAPDPVVW